MSVDWYGIGVDAGKIVLAYLAALPIGWDREREAHSMGVRTFPLTAMASCAYVLIGSGLGSDAESRIIQGLLAGIGFIGAGAILKGQGSVHGAATAASIFNTGVIGASIALGRFHLGILLAVLNLLTLRLLLPLMKRVGPDGTRAEEEEKQE